MINSVLMNVETVIFSRPNSNKKEEGLRITQGDTDRSIIIDSDMNIVINAVYHEYHDDIESYILNSEL